MTVIIYGLCEPNTDYVRYVGKTKNGPLGRYKGHCNDYKGTTRKCRWIASLRNKGLKPSIITLEEVPDSEWDGAERKWVAYFRSIRDDLTNHTDGGDGRTGFTEEERAKASKEMKKRMADPEFKKKIFTKERAAKLSAALAGKSKSEEHIANLPQNQKGYKHCEEFGDKISKSMMGNQHLLGHFPSDETKAKISSSLKGRISPTLGRKTPEHEKVAKSLACRKPKSDEARANIAKGARKRWEKRKADGAAPYKRTTVKWPDLGWLERQLETNTIGKVAELIGVKPGTLSAYLGRRRRGAKIMPNWAGKVEP